VKADLGWAWQRFLIVALAEVTAKLIEGRSLTGSGAHFLLMGISGIDHSEVFRSASGRG